MPLITGSQKSCRKHSQQRQVEACERRCMSSCMDQSRRPVKHGWEAAGKCTAVLVYQRVFQSSWISRMIPVLFISIYYVFLTLSLPLYNFQKKTSVQDNVKWNLLFSTSSFDTFCIYSCTLVNILCGFFKVKLNWCIVTFCNLWVVGLKLSRYVVIYIPFFWEAELCTYLLHSIFSNLHH